MENYLLCGELGSTAGVFPNSRASESDSNSGSCSELNNGGCLFYKGRKKGSVEFVGIWKHSKAKKDLVANGVSLLKRCCFLYVHTIFEFPAADTGLPSIPIVGYPTLRVRVIRFRSRSIVRDW